MLQGVADAIAILSEEDGRSPAVLGATVTPPCNSFFGNLDLYAVTCTAEDVLSPEAQIINSVVTISNSNGGRNIFSQRNAPLEDAVQNLLEEDCAVPFDGCASAPFCAVLVVFLPRQAVVCGDRAAEGRTLRGSRNLCMSCCFASVLILPPRVCFMLM